MQRAPPQPCSKVTGNRTTQTPHTTRGIMICGPPRASLREVGGNWPRGRKNVRHECEGSTLISRDTPALKRSQISKKKQAAQQTHGRQVASVLGYKFSFTHNQRHTNRYEKMHSVFIRLATGKRRGRTRLAVVGLVWGGGVAHQTGEGAASGCRFSGGESTILNVPLLKVLLIAWKPQGRRRKMVMRHE